MRVVILTENRKVPKYQHNPILISLLPAWNMAMSEGVFIVSPFSLLCQKESDPLLLATLH